VVARARGGAAVLPAGLDLGITFWDTANVYQKGSSEEIVGAALHAKYDRYGPGPVGAITGAGAHAATLLVVPEV
jgi:hypothetical protein